MELYDFTVRNAQGIPVSLSQYKGRVLLIVNTATGCGFTPQYEGLQQLYEKYTAQGFDVLDFPCNQFGAQAPGTIEEISTFCTLNYHTTFPRFDKINVNGKEVSPLYDWLKEQKKGLFGDAIKWNFTKFLIDRTGQVTERFAPDKKPQDLESSILKLL